MDFTAIHYQCLLSNEKTESTTSHRYNFSSTEHSQQPDLAINLSDNYNRPLSIKSKLYSFIKLVEMSMTRISVTSISIIRSNSS